MCKGSVVSGQNDTIRTIRNKINKWKWRKISILPVILFLFPLLFLFPISLSWFFFSFFVFPSSAWKENWISKEMKNKLSRTIYIVLFFIYVFSYFSFMSFCPVLTPHHVNVHGFTQFIVLVRQCTVNYHLQFTAGHVNNERVVHFQEVDCMKIFSHFVLFRKISLSRKIVWLLTHLNLFSQVATGESLILSGVRRWQSDTLKDKKINKWKVFFQYLINTEKQAKFLSVMIFSLSEIIQHLIMHTFLKKQSVVRWRYYWIWVALMCLKTDKRVSVHHNIINIL